MLRIAAGTAERHLAPRVALLSAKMVPMRVDDSTLGNLAKPAKRFPMAEIGLWQRANSLDANLLKHVVDFDFAPQSRPQLAIDKCQEGFSLRQQVIGQCRQIALLDAVH